MKISCFNDLVRLSREKTEPTLTTDNGHLQVPHLPVHAENLPMPVPQPENLPMPAPQPEDADDEETGPVGVVVEPPLAEQAREECFFFN